MNETNLKDYQDLGFVADWQLAHPMYLNCMFAAHRIETELLRVNVTRKHCPTCKIKYYFKRSK